MLNLRKKQKIKIVPNAQSELVYLRAYKFRPHRFFEIPIIAWEIWLGLDEEYPEYRVVTNKSPVIFGEGEQDDLFNAIWNKSTGIVYSEDGCFREQFTRGEYEAYAAEQLDWPAKEPAE